MFAAVARLVRRLAMRAGFRPVTLKRCRLSSRDGLSIDLLARWWATDEDVRAAVARTIRRLNRRLRRKGYRVRLTRPIRYEKGPWRWGF